MIYSPPRYIQFFPSFGCDRECKFCFNKDIIPNRVAAPDEFAFMLQRMAKGGIFELDILGGEPTLYPHLEHLVDTALGNKIKVFLSSNGLDTNLLIRILGKNHNRNFLNIGISLNDSELSDELYDFISFEKPFIKSVVTKDRVLPESAKLILQNPEITYYLLFMDALTKADLDISFPFPEFFRIFEEIRKRFKNIKPIYCEGFLSSTSTAQYRCPAGTAKISVMPDGSVYPCYLFFRHENYRLGNILHDDLRKILQNPILDFFREFKVNKCPSTDCRFHNKCHGGCPAVSLLITGDIESPDPRCLSKNF